MKPLRIWLVGTGTVGTWLAGVLGSQRERLAASYGLDTVVVGAASARGGFVYDADGLDLASLPAAARGSRPAVGGRGAGRWPSAIEGLRATEADLLVEVSASPAADGEPGVTHMREALQRRIPVVTSNKWPVALHGTDLAALARNQGVAFRAESTVMSGTPVLSTLTEGLAGAIPIALRGLLNATANFILSRMADGRSYEDALAEAQRAGLAERDPAADVEGHDTVAKVMILSGLVFGRQLRREQVTCRGITRRHRAGGRRGGLGRGAHQARRDAQLWRAGRIGQRDRPRAARVRRPRRSAGERQRHHQRRGIRGGPGGAGHGHRPRRRAPAGRAGGPQRHHRGREPPGGGRVAATLRPEGQIPHGPVDSLPQQVVVPGTLVPPAADPGTRHAGTMRRSAITGTSPPCGWTMVWAVLSAQPGREEGLT